MLDTRILQQHAPHISLKPSCLPYWTALTPLQPAVAGTPVHQFAWMLQQGMAEGSQRRIFYVPGAQVQPTQCLTLTSVTAGAQTPYIQPRWWHRNMLHSSDSLYYARASDMYMAAKFARGVGGQLGAGSGARERALPDGAATCPWAAQQSAEYLCTGCLCFSRRGSDWEPL